MKFHPVRTVLVCLAVFGAIGSGVLFAASGKSPLGNVGVPTTTTVTSSANPSTFGSPVTFTATVTANAGAAPQSSAPSGSVTFRDGITPLGTVALDVAGVAMFTTSALATGSHNITAAYGGGGGFAASTSAILVQGVNAPAAGVEVPTLGGTALVLLGLGLVSASLWLMRRA